MRLDHLLSKEYMYLEDAWHLCKYVHSRSTTDDANENSLMTFDRKIVGDGEVQGSEAPLGWKVEDHGTLCHPELVEGLQKCLRGSHNRGSIISDA